MRVHIIYTPGGPFKVFADGQEAYREYERLLSLDDLVGYSLMDLPVEGKEDDDQTRMDS